MIHPATEQKTLKWKDKKHINLQKNNFLPVYRAHAMGIFSTNLTTTG